MPEATQTTAPVPLRHRARLGLFFGAAYFTQGLAEPGEGLIAQPVKYLLQQRGLDISNITGFTMLLGLPWVFKPLYGLITDFVPLLGYRRKSYLLISHLVAGACLLGLFAFQPSTFSTHLLLCLLLLPVVAIAFGDVVTDGLMIEVGQPLGITGQLQSVQWFSIYAAGIPTGLLAGKLIARGHEEYCFLICAVALFSMFTLTLLFVREGPVQSSQASISSAWQAMRETATSPVVVAVGGFLFLWAFNPFSTTVLQYHMTESMGFSQEFYGQTQSYLAVGSVVASACYGLYCNRVSLPALLHASVVLGVLSTLTYWLMTDKLSAILVTLFVGFSYMTATLIQLDLAARTCPPRLAATAFALLMAVSNFSLSTSMWLGGWLYKLAKERWTAESAFQLVVGIGGLSTALCWLLVPYLRRAAAAAANTSPVQDEGLRS